MGVSLNDFERETECIYKGEHYSVRDNGAILRHARENKRLRKYDNQWTFGKPNNNGYMLISSEIIHRIIAYAFIGEPPTAQHIVDHIDTNRQNNRPENLRWLTKLENILRNPITVKKIIFHCGSIEVFLRDPSILRNYISADPNFEWMRAVTPKEAQISWERLKNWAKKENDSTSSDSHSLGEWIFVGSQFYEVQEIITSQTPNAVQKNWKTPCEFPCCPQEITDTPILTYTSNLKIGIAFSRNKYSDSIISDFATSEDGKILWIMSKNSEKNAVKPWCLAQITFENDLFVHASLGSFFQEIGAEKEFTLVQGLEWTKGDTFDDFT